MDVANIKISTPQGEVITLQEAYNRSGFEGDFYIDVWGAWCGPCLRIKPFLKDYQVIYIHLGKTSGGYSNHTIPDSFEIGPNDYICTISTAKGLAVNGVPFVKKVDKDLIMSSDRYYPGPMGMQIMKQ